MATRSDNTATVRKSVDDVLAAFRTREYWEYVAAHHSTKPGVVSSFDGTTIILDEILPPEMMPDMARMLASGDVNVRRVITLTGDREFTYTADLLDTPVKFWGSARIGGDQSATTIVYSNENSVEIPLLGPMLEEKVVRKITELFDREATLTDDWIGCA